MDRASRLDRQWLRPGARRGRWPRPWSGCRFSEPRDWYGMYRGHRLDRGDHRSRERVVAEVKVRVEIHQFGGSAVWREWPQGRISNVRHKKLEELCPRRAVG